MEIFTYIAVLLFVSFFVVCGLKWKFIVNYKTFPFAWLSALFLVGHKMDEKNSIRKHFIRLAGL